jgi:DNA-directed RNA polymerase specialized sigma24 family protein
MASEGPPDREAVAEFERQLNTGILDRLLLHASNRLNALVWLGVWRGAPPAAREPEDFVQEAVAKFLYGRRKWDKKDSLWVFLVQVINSDIYNLVYSKENIKVRRLDREETLAAADAPGLDEQETWEQILAELDDPFLRELARLIGEEGISRRRELAERTGKTPQEISNAEKRLRRRLEKSYRRRSSGQGPPRLGGPRLDARPDQEER